MSEWQPIETAPKDGLFIMAVRAGDERRTFVAQADYPPSGFRWITTHGLWWDGIHTDWTPTHWQPLPEPPK